MVLANLANVSHTQVGDLTVSIFNRQAIVLTACSVWDKPSSGTPLPIYVYSTTSLSFIATSTFKAVKIIVYE